MNMSRLASYAQSLVPFAVVGCNAVKTVESRPVRGRQTKFGFVEGERAAASSLSFHSIAVNRCRTFFLNLVAYFPALPSSIVAHCSGESEPLRLLGAA